MPITSQAHLRPLRDDDAEAILDAFQSGPEGMSGQGDVVDDESARRYIQRFADNAAMDAAVVANTDTGQLLGLVTVMRDGTNRSGWFAYWMHPRSRGRGLATRAALAMASSELTDGGLERLELGHRANNPASGAVSRGAGFILEGTQRGHFLIDGERHDVHTYGRLADDPVPSTESLPWASGARPWHRG
ncbi:GNAT family N-acetyltransferase [uncultured Micrococcus sp.]|uniref:GNAT family N-acetyltransferase n=1 Tax=uncultured Micrococcus sp. TaxID=114051 RepID=UPI0026286A2F|nr:GNAT family protein [uncultured Micrococcus sp.]